MRTLDASIHELARRQYGLVTRRQLAERGVDRRYVARRLRAGVWRSPFPTVIDVGTHPASWEKSVRAVVLAAGPNAWASHATAAVLHGMLDVARPATVDVTVLRGRRTMAGDVALHTTLRLEADESTTVGGIPVTSRPRTVVDLAPGLDDGHLELLVGDELRRWRGGTELLARVAARRPGWSGSARVLEVLRRMPESVGRTDSFMEVRAVVRLVVRAGLPEPEVQGEIRDADGRFLARGDLVWRDAGLIVELIGRRFHGTPSRRAADLERTDRLHAAGWDVIEVYWEDLDGPAVEALVARLGARLDLDDA